MKKDRQESIPILTNLHDFRLELVAVTQAIEEMSELFIVINESLMTPSPVS